MFRKIGLLFAMQLVWVMAQSPILLNLTQYKVTLQQDGNQTVERFEIAAGNKPGDVLEYRLEAKNVSDKSFKNVELIIPIPGETTYIDKSAQPLVDESGTVMPQFSSDGGANYSFPPLRKKVRVIENGKEVEKEVEVKPEEYTNARWLLPTLVTKQTRLLKLRVSVR